MSQLFDALRRGRRRPRAERRQHRTAHGEAILATLGYTPVRRMPRIPGAAVALVAAGLALGGYAAWRVASGETRPLRLEASADPPPPPVARAEKPAAATAAPAPLETSPEVPKIEAGIVPATVPDSPETPDEAPEEPESAPPAPPKPASSDAFGVPLHFQQGTDLDRAMHRYRAILARDEANARAHNNLGVVYLEQGRLDDAVRSLERAVSIDPNYAKARLNLGVALMRQGRSNEAAAEFRAVLEQRPNDAGAIVNLALVERTASPERARELLLRAVAVSPRDALAHYNLAVLYDSTGEVGSALKHYRAFLDAAAPEHAVRASEVQARVAVLSKR